MKIKHINCKHNLSLSVYIVTAHTRMASKLPACKCVKIMINDQCKNTATKKQLNKVNMWDNTCTFVNYRTITKIRN